MGLSAVRRASPAHGSQSLPRGPGLVRALLLALALASPAASADDPAFARFVADYFDAYLRDSPVTATYLGVHAHDHRLDDLSQAAIRRRIEVQQAFLARLVAIDRAALDLDARIDAAAIEADIRAELLDAATLRSWESNPMPYVALPGQAIDALVKRAFAPAPERLRAVVSRLRAVPATYAAARANLRNPPREFTELAIRMAEGSVGYYAESLAAWAHEAAGDDAGLRAEFATANAAAAAAARSLLAWLSEELLPASQGDYAIGAGHFLAKLRYEEMIEMPLAELLALGEAQLARDHAAFVATARRIDPRRSAGEVMRAVSDEHPGAAGLLPAVRRTVEEARRFLVEHDIVTVPSELRLRVEETPPYDRAGSFASMDTPGPFETVATEAFYYVTPVEPHWSAEHAEQHLRLFNRWVVAMINVHEVWPGHYLQFLYAPRFPTRTRQILSAASNAEGWAHYAEQMMVEEGFGGGDPRMRLAQLQEALLRDCRFVAGIKLHTAGWSVERAARELFEAQGFQEPANALEEARRGTYDPTYLYYTLGKLEIYRLREDYMRRTGASLREFHDAFVTQGALPIPLVRRLLLRDAAGD